MPELPRRALAYLTGAGIAVGLGCGIAWFTAYRIARWIVLP